MAYTVIKSNANDGDFMLTSYKHTLRASYLGHITQAIINNFTPLLFLTFSSQYGLPLYKITLLVTINFLLQLSVDFAAASFVDKIGYRKCIVTAHLFCTVGLLFLGTLPNIMSSPFTGLMISLFFYALGGGLIEVLIAPIVEACPSENKESNMSLLHFFYSFGHVGVVVISALFFFFFGIKNWHILSIIWACVPLLNMIYFLCVPIYTLPEENNREFTVGKLFSSKIFLLFILLMFLSGASEQSMNQWASAFAESALLNTSLSKYAKILGDLCGPCIFALMMGLSRLLYSKFTKKIDLEHLMTLCSGLCATAYLCCAVSPQAFVKLFCCGFCGLCMGIAWPGLYLMMPKYCRGAGTASFALLALGGDLGCAVGPTVVGLISDANDSLFFGIFLAGIFPILLTCGLLFLKIIFKVKKKEN